MPFRHCARPTIIDGGEQMPVGGRTPSSVPRAAGHPLLVTAKLPKKQWVLVFDRSTAYFLCQTLQNQAAISDHKNKNGNFAFLSFLDPPPFCLPLFCPLSPFLALIRVTLGFFVVFPNKSHTLIRVTLGFNFFGLNKSHTLIRVTFGGK